MLSVIVPVYNQAQYLKECIDSVLDQNVQGEIIIVIDGSTDKSLEIAKQYEKDRPDIIKVINQVNKGLASARNTGIMNTYPFSDWLLPLDADDKLKPNAIEKIEEKIKEDPMVDVIGLSLRTFGTSDEEIILMPEPKLEDFRTGNRLGYCAAIRKAALMEVGGYSPKMVEGYEDLHLWCNLLVRGKKIITIPEVLWMYRTKEESMWTKAKEYHQKLIDQINFDVPEAKLNF